MTNSKSDKIAIRGFSLVFEQMCNFIAVVKTGDPRSTIRGLISMCLLEFPDECFDGADTFSDSIETLFDIVIPDHQIEEALNALERDRIISRPAGSNYKLSSEVIGELRDRVQDARDLEERVKSAWFEQLEVTHPNLPLDSAWKALQSYLARTFRRHGIQTVALLDPTIETPSEHEISLTTILRESIQKHLTEELHCEASRALSDFLAMVGTDTDRSRYIIQLADGAFNFYILEVPTELAEQLRSQLKALTLFLDTNFLFGILDLHYNIQVEISHDLLSAISKYTLPFKLRYHEATAQEMYNTINHYGDILRSRVWTRSLSSAASRSRNLSGIEQKFHERNASHSIDVDEFLRPFEHFDQLLADKDIKIYRPHEKREQARIDLFHEYQEFLKNNGRGDKLYETIMHDARVLEEARHLRTDAKSSLEAGALIISCDYYLFRFDWESARRNGHRACVLLPNIFWQILRPFVSIGQDFDKAFAETFALPEFRTLSSGSGKACSKMLQILATYKDVPERTALKLISNDLLLDRLRTAKDDAEFAEQVETAFVEENRNLLEEKAALERQLEEEKRKRMAEANARSEEHQEYQQRQEELNQELIAVREELTTAKRAIEEHREAAEFVALRNKEIEKSTHDPNAKMRERRQDVENAEQRAFRMSVIAGIAIGGLLIVAFELTIYLIPWNWLVEHKNSLPLQIGISLTLMLAMIGLIVKDWRKWCWGIALLPMVLSLISLLGG